MIRLDDKLLPEGLSKELFNYHYEFKHQTFELDVFWKKCRKRKAFGDIEELLKSMCPNIQNCCYCEDGNADDIDHFFPKSIYPELTFEWYNYLYACVSCNKKKGNRFLMLDEQGYDVISHNVCGSPKLINPRYENPMNFIMMEFVTFKYDSVPNLSLHDVSRAKYTIEHLGLNRRNLLEKRAGACDGFLDWLDGYELKRHRSDLENHIHKLKKKPHLSVWEEMRRVCRHERFEQLKDSSEHLKIIYEKFQLAPEAFDISPFSI
jgi:uncharacterized protein (TIGR02646 family)